MTALAENMALSADLMSARRTLRLEISGLEALSAGLGQPFVSAIDVFAAVAGRAGPVSLGGSLVQVRVPSMHRCLLVVLACSSS